MPWLFGGLYPVELQVIEAWAGTLGDSGRARVRQQLDAPHVVVNRGYRGKCAKFFFSKPQLLPASALFPCRECAEIARVRLRCVRRDETTDAVIGLASGLLTSLAFDRSPRGACEGFEVAGVEPRFSPDEVSPAPEHRGCWIACPVPGEYLELTQGRDETSIGDWRLVGPTDFERIAVGPINHLIIGETEQPESLSERRFLALREQDGGLVFLDDHQEPLEVVDGPLLDALLVSV